MSKMSCPLPIDCLNEIFEYLEDDKINLHSCLLVNRLWCKIVVRILWRDIWGLQYSIGYNSYRIHVPLSITNTLINCLPDESKDLLNKNGIFISKLTLKPPLFNYASFIKVLSINKFDEMIQHIFENQKFVIIDSLSLNYKKHLIEKEIIKMFMIQISSLKKLKYYQTNLHFIYFPGTKDCLNKLSELNCGSDVDSHFFYQLSPICNNLKSLTIEFRNSVSNGLAHFMSIQKNLKILKFSSYRRRRNILPALTNLFNNLINKLKEENFITKSFFTNLQELDLSIEYKLSFEELKNLIFPNLQILKIRFIHPNDDIIIKFLENSGRNLKELNIDGIDSSLRSSIAKFCPNLRKISSILTDDGLVTLKIIFDNCKYLESIEIWYDFLSSQSSEKEILDVVAKHSQNNFFELKLYELSSELLPEDLESFLIGWKNRIPKKSINLIRIKNEILNNNVLDISKEILKIIEKYKNLGIIKKFGTEIRNSFLSSFFNY
ncbi:uncharacterized protein OCT59_012037 [Rhizophagus irregularis]|uniref:uncharacterized protein n=2 Tax=Rhizophagus irregularis TaxID=588596 RepID=UPI001C1BBE50|nr:hypothetical protein OCT59_012037 [Rhizophagus irregularis]CAB5360792.1 unnamed protein product [Rhizophagus irregularis]